MINCSCSYNYITTTRAQKTTHGLDNCIPLLGNFGNCTQWHYLNLFRFTVYHETRVTQSCSTPPNHIQILQGRILITMENYSDSDTSSESEYDSSEGSAAVSDCDEDEPSQDLEPESSEYYDRALYPNRFK